MDIQLEEKLRLLRNQRNWTQQYAADKLGVSEAVYAKYETGAKQLRASIIYRISILFGVSADWLLGLKN